MGQAWEAIREAVGADLSEFRDLAGLIRTGFRLVLAAALGGLLGFERTVRRRPAGLRTYMLVALGAAAYVCAAEGFGITLGAMSRVIQGLLTGIGFLGAGAIFKAEDHAQTFGLTTAAGIWVTAAVGLAVGLGQPATALLVTALGLVVLAPMRRLEGKVDESRRHKDAGAAHPPEP